MVGSGGAAPSSGGVGGETYGYTDGSGGADAVPLGLVGAPMVVLPTEDSFDVSVIHRGDPIDSLVLQYRPLVDLGSFTDAGPPVVMTDEIAQFHVSELQAGTVYQYQVLDTSTFPVNVLYLGRAVTQRPAGDEFDFALITDTHITPRQVGPGESPLYYEEEYTLWEVAEQLQAIQPDFVVNLGDMLDFHVFGFNVAPPSADYTRLAYLNYRRLLRDSIGRAAHFPVIGNWDGENGDFTDMQIEQSRQVRTLYAPSPGPDTYPQGGGPHRDYYAFTWGDALFAVLNVMTYTEGSHLLSFDPGLVDDWTLGDEQLLFLEQTLAASTSTWKFLMIHHTVGGAAATMEDAAYGRGGGQAAQVGEQAIVHGLMETYGVQIFFYGHDHVFTDMIVDGIHYTLPGSAGAPWKFGGEYTGYQTYWTDSGHGRVHVSPERVEVEFVSITGEILHSYELESATPSY